jgi:hypothetical protein
MHSDWFNGIEILQGRWQHGEKVGHTCPVGHERLMGNELRRLEGSMHDVCEGTCCSIYLPRWRKITKFQAGNPASHLNLKVNVGLFT